MSLNAKAMVRPSITSDSMPSEAINLVPSAKGSKAVVLASGRTMLDDNAHPPSAVAIHTVERLLISRFIAAS